MTSAPLPHRMLLYSGLFGGMGLASALPSSAEIVGTFSFNPDGTVTYFYEVDNSAGLFDIALWSLDFEFPGLDWDPRDVAAGGDVTIPNLLWLPDLGIPVVGQSAQDFLSLDPSGDVLVGSILSGFSFTSARLPGQVVYHEFSATGESRSGTTFGPVGLIPEAQTWLTGLGISALLVGSLVRRLARRARG